MKNEKWMEMDKEWMKYGWRMDNSGWNRINIDAEKKKYEKWMETGWKWKYRACVKSRLYKTEWPGIKQN